MLLIGAMAGSTALILLLLPRPYWLDEVASVLVANQPTWREVLRFAATDIHPPFYFFLLRLWGMAFGYSEIATGLLSLLLAAVAAGLVYHLGRVFGDTWTGAIAAVLFWCSATAVNFATETRMYTLVIIAALLATLALYRMATGGGIRYAWLYFGATLLGMYTHYFYWILVLSHGMAVVAFHVFSRGRFPWRRWALAVVSAGILFSPWLPIMIFRLAAKHSQLQLEVGRDWIPRLVFSAGRYALTILGSLLLNLPGQEQWWLWHASPPFWYQCALIFFVSLIFGRWYAGRWYLRYRFRRPTSGVVVLGASILGAIVLVSAFNLPIPRYYIFVGPLCALTAALLLRRLRRSRRNALAACAALMLVGGNWWYYFTVDSNRALYGWPGVAHFLSAQSEPTERVLILTAAFEEQMILDFYYRGPWPVESFLPRQYLDAQHPVLSRLRRVALDNITAQNVGELANYLDRYDVFWVVDGGSRFYADPQGVFWPWLLSHCGNATDYRITSANRQEFDLITRLTDCQADFSPIFAGQWRGKIAKYTNPLYPMMRAGGSRSLVKHTSGE